MMFLKKITEIKQNKHCVKFKNKTELIDIEVPFWSENETHVDRVVMKSRDSKKHVSTNGNKKNNKSLNFGWAKPRGWL